MSLVFLASWGLIFGMTAIVPLDLIIGGSDLMTVVWMVLYWSSFIFAWIIGPTLHYFYLSGCFTFGSRLVDVLKQSKYFLFGGILAFASLLLWVGVAFGLQLQDISSILTCTTMIVNFFYFVWVFASGLAQLPKKLYYYSLIGDAGIEWWYYNIFALQYSLQLEKREHEFTRKIIKTCVAKGPQFSQEIDQISKTCPEAGCYEFLEVGPATIKLLFRDAGLSKLSHEVSAKKILFSHMTHLHAVAIQQNNTLQETKAHYRWLDHQLKIVNRRKCSPIYGIFSLLTFVVSFLFLWMECVVFVPSISLMPSLFTAISSNSERSLVMYIPWAMMCLFCFSWVTPIYGSNRTSHPFFLKKTIAMLRVFPALAMNFYLLTNIQDNSFAKVVGTMYVVPFFGKGLHLYLAPLVVLVVASQYLDFHHIMFCIPKFSDFKKKESNQYVPPSGLDPLVLIHAQNHHLKVDENKVPLIGASPIMINE